VNAVEMVVRDLPVVGQAHCERCGKKVVFRFIDELLCKKCVMEEIQQDLEEE
jgi:hypothetical protein